MVRELEMHSSEGTCQGSEVGVKRNMAWAGEEVRHRAAMVGCREEGVAPMHRERGMQRK